MFAIIMIQEQATISSLSRQNHQLNLKRYANCYLKAQADGFWIFHAILISYGASQLPEEQLLVIYMNANGFGLEFV